MPWGATTVRWIWCVRALVVCGALLLASSLGVPAWAEDSYEIAPLGTDSARNVDRYQITLGPGASLWEVGFNRLPLISIEQGDSKVVELLGDEFVRAYTTMRRYELQRFADHVTDWELTEYLELY